MGYRSVTFSRQLSERLCRDCLQRRIRQTANKLKETDSSSANLKIKVKKKYLIVSPFYYKYAVVNVTF